LRRALDLAITGISSIKLLFYLQFCVSKHAKFAGLEKGVEDKSFRTEQDKAHCTVTSIIAKNTRIRPEIPVFEGIPGGCFVF